MGDTTLACGDDHVWYPASSIYPGKPCQDPPGMTLAADGYVCRPGVGYWQKA